MCPRSAPLALLAGAATLLLATAQRYPQDYDDVDAGVAPPARAGYDRPQQYPARRELDRARTSTAPQVRAFLRHVDAVTAQECTKNVLAQWAYETNVNPLTQEAATASQLQYAAFQRAVKEKLDQITRDEVPDDKLWREIRILTTIGPSALPPHLLDRYNKIINDMLTVFNSATICAYENPFNCGLKLDPDLTLIMARSRDWDELQHVWVEWRRKTGEKVKDLYKQLVDLSNQAARLNKLRDTAEYWMFPYESPTLRADLEDVWDSIRPLYDQLHAYVRRKLRDLYGPDKISQTAPLPAHVLGNMWAQSWSNILDVTIPYPGKNYVDVSTQMVEQGYNPFSIFKLAEDFYLSLNLSAMPAEFWAGSIIEQPADRIINCQPSAWDFCNQRDYRIKMCTQVNMKDFVTAHHEMGHIQYFLYYRHLPKAFRDGANPGFHEAVGDAVALSVATPGHLQDLGLLQTSVDDLPHDVNYLFALALDKLAFLPFSLALDRWRWDVFRGDVRDDQYTCHWWQLREQYSGIKPPVLRSETDFDPGSKYHVPANIPYIRYFVGTVLQFQLHSALCRAAGQFDPGRPQGKPLHKCDLYRSKEAGNLLSRMMRLGSSEPWSEALFQATGESRLNGSHLREFFRPLEEWLRLENLRTQQAVGWNYDGDYCRRSLETTGIRVRLQPYNTAASPRSPAESALSLAAQCVLVSLATRIAL
ncbi:angiotensin-converting enzyme [Bacillus rossius redtenbacheri]|uniref:angiotensin-converting enzyme n=1 Tax=Bacillus rossius redtenbacheri TaxID=93214 RepID=UPI002FDE9E3B